MGILFIIFWTIGYPFIYTFLLARIFGIKKGIDRGIVFCLNNVTSIGVLLLLISDMWPESFNLGILAHAICLAIKTVLDGLVWQFYLRDRTTNGFLISFICAFIFMIPYFFSYVLG